MASENEKIQIALSMLSSFEEEMSDFYSEVARLCTQFTDFWESASMAKATRANLYANLAQDFASNLDCYILQREVSGTFINLFNKVKTQKSHLTPELLKPETTGAFMREIEAATTNAGIMPIVIGETPMFEKIYRILTKTQSTQVRLVEGFLRSHRNCR